MKREQGGVSQGEREREEGKYICLPIKLSMLLVLDSGPCRVKFSRSES